MEVGEILSKVLNVHITAETLPDGKMYFNIADRVLNETLKNNYSLVSDYTEGVQIRLNRQAGLKLRAQRPDFDQDRVKGFVNKLSSADDFTDVQWVLGDPMVNFTQSVVDEAIKKNAKFQELKYNKNSKYDDLRKEYDFHSELKEKNWNEGYKNKVAGYHDIFRDEGQSLSVHATSRLDRIEKKGFKIITINDVLDLSKRKPDFRQNDVKVVHFDESLQLAIIRNTNTNDIVSIVRRKHKKDGWYEI